MKDHFQLERIQRALAEVESTRKELIRLALTESVNRRFHSPELMEEAIKLSKTLEKKILDKIY